MTVLLKDYRELEGRYDTLVSIEMIEAVGHHYLPTYLHQCSRLLKPDGMLLLQAITMADQEYERARRTVDFIQHYIFPGGCLPSTTAIIATLSQVTDLRLFHFEDIGAHYALTLRHWRQRFLSQGQSPGLQRHLYLHGGVLPVLLRRRLQGALDQRRSDAVYQALMPARSAAA